MCPSGFGGDRCENSLEECLVEGYVHTSIHNNQSTTSRRPCLNNGICNEDGEGPVCTCPEPFSGKWCEGTTGALFEGLNKTADSCTPNPCQNSGECSGEGGRAVCYCLDNFVGDHCELECKCPADTLCRENLLKKGHTECLRVPTSTTSSSEESNSDERLTLSTPSSSLSSLIDLSPVWGDFAVRIEF
jgi:hypothetical protein